MIFFIALSIATAFGAYSFARDERWAATAITALLLVLIVKKTVDLRRWIKHREAARAFGADEATAEIYPAAPVVWCGARKAPEGVLLLHGFSASPAEFAPLTDKLKERDVPFYAPTLTGFGIESLHLLRVVHSSDWLRDALRAYDVVASRAERVHVFGHSMGAIMAAFVAQRRAVDKLVLSAPYLHPKRKHDVVKEIFKTPLLSDALVFLMPYRKKSSKSKPPKGAENRVAFRVSPTNSIRAIWEAQDKLRFEEAKFSRALLLEGGKDATVEIDRVVQTLEYHKLPYDLKRYENSGHLLYEDADKERVASDVVAWLFGAERK
jgi:carboxylesterase